MPAATINKEQVQNFTIQQDIAIAAPIETAWEAVLEQLGPRSEMPDGKPFPFKLEAWPGGRLWRNLGNNTGHLWGHVQVIKPPKLLEVYGPMMMSYPAINHFQYRLTSEPGGVTRLQLTHKAMGLIPDEHRDGMAEGFGFWIQRVKKLAEERASKE